MCPACIFELLQLVSNGDFRIENLDAAKTSTVDESLHK